MKILYETSLINSLRERLASKDDRSLRDLLREMINALGYEFVAILEKLFKVSDKENRKKLCRCLSELGLHLDLWSREVGYLYRLISENCQKIYLADFKVMLNHNTLMKKRLIDADFYERYGSDLVYIFETLLNYEMDMGDEFHKRLVNNIPDRVIRQIRDLTNYIYDNYVLMRRGIIYLCELLINKLKILGISNDSDLSAYILDKIKMLDKPLDYRKAIILTFTLMHLPTKNINKLFRTILKVASDIPSLIGVVSGIVLSIIHGLDLAVFTKNKTNTTLVWLFIEKIMTRTSEDLIELTDLAKRKLTNILFSKICMNFARIVILNTDNSLIQNRILDCIYAIGVNYPSGAIMIMKDITNKKLDPELISKILKIMGVFITRYPKLQSQFALILNNLVFNTDLKIIRSIARKEIIRKYLANLLRMSKSLELTRSIINLIKYFMIVDLNANSQDARLLSILNEINDDVIRLVINYLESKRI